MLKYFLALALLTATAPAQPSAVLTDTRDGKSYRTVKIGEQVWMAENLNFEADSSRCYENKAENCEKYGRLYDWQTALKSCPVGWHLPTKVEWERMTKYIGGEKTEGKKLKAMSGWNDYKGKSGNGTDDYGFAALPGSHGYSDGRFGLVGNASYWWSATERNAYDAYSRNMDYYGSRAYWSSSIKDYHWFSVRCVRD